MRDPNRIYTILSRLTNIWAKFPDLRLGQLLLNVFGENIQALYAMEDEQIIQAIEAFYK